MSTTIAPSELKTRKQAAEYLDLQPQTLACWAVSGKYGLRFLKIGGNVRYRQSDLDKWLESRTVVERWRSERSPQRSPKRSP